MLMVDFKERAVEAIRRLRRIDLDGLLLFPGADIGYFTGLAIGPSERLAAAVIPTESEASLVVNELEKELRGQRPWIRQVEVWREHEDPVKLLADVIARLGLSKGKIGVSEDAYWGWVNRLQAMLPDASFVDASPQLQSIRMIKSPDEIDWTRKACEIADRALLHNFEQLRVGTTERQLAALITSEMKNLGGGEVFCSVLFGARAALPHGVASEDELKPGQSILVDTGATYQGYWSDLTRTVFFGEPTRRQREIYSTVLGANEAAFKAAEPGKACETVDAKGREVINDAGFGPNFIHRLGHGVGLQVHEHPYIVRGNRLRLKPGMAFTIEPGIYIVGEIGVRVEDTVLCTPQGCERLTGFVRELLTYPART